MKDRSSNQFTYIEDKSIEPIIFKQVHAEPILVQTKILPFMFFTKRMSKNQLEQVSDYAKHSLIADCLAQLKPERT